MGEIPVLEIDGERLTQTAPILLKLAENTASSVATTEQEQFELLRWLFWDNHKLTGYMATYRYYRDVHADARRACPEAFPPAAGRLPVHSGAACRAERLRARRPADHRRYLDDGLSAFSRG